MKHIVKSLVQQFLNNNDWAKIHKNERRQILVEEQGYICAYTMLGISGFDKDNKAIIEHYLPQKLYPNIANDYNNQLACYKEKSLPNPFGEAQKGEYDPSKNSFVSPLENSCEIAFQYNNDGTIEGLNQDAIATIKILKLDAKELNDLRLKALQGIGLAFTLEENPFGELLTPIEKNSLAQQAYNKRNHKYIPFCVAIKQVASI